MNKSIILRSIRRLFKWPNREIKNSYYILYISKFREYVRRHGFRQALRKSYEKITRTIKQPHFQQALTEHMNRAVLANHPMYYIYLEYASSTVERGDAVVKIISNYTKIKGKRYLDVGCAYGGFPIAFARAGAAKVIGVDINDDYIKLFHELLKDYECPIQPKFLIYDILKHNSKNNLELGKFDIITCNDVIEHVSSPELLVKNLSNLTESEGILYLEIPNAYNYEMVVRDGHYGLFGITLLDPVNALLYYEHHFKSLTYDMGEYLDLNGYIELFRSYEFEPVLLNDVFQSGKKLNQNVHNIQHNIQSLPSVYKNISKTLPSYLKDHMEKVLKDYIDRFLLSYEKFLKSNGDAKIIIAKQIYVYYGINFWRFLLRKKQK